MALEINDASNKAWADGLTPSGKFYEPNKPKYNTQERGFNILEDNNGNFSAGKQQQGDTYPLFGARFSNYKGVDLAQECSKG